MTIHQRAQRRILEHALLRWESAFVIALTIVLTGGSLILGVAGLGWYFYLLASFWLLFGIVGEATLIYFSYQDEAQNERLVAEMLQADFHPTKLKDDELQDKVYRAQQYRSRIEAAISKQQDGALKTQLGQTADRIDEWLQSIFHLAKRLDQYETERPWLTAEEGRISQQRDSLARQQADDSTTQAQLAATLQTVEQQLQTMTKLEQTMTQAHLQLEHTLSALGTIYSQTMLMNAKGAQSGRETRQLTENIKEEMDQLDDTLSAMDEVYQ